MDAALPFPPRSKQAGTYLLLMPCTHICDPSIGGLGRCHLDKGYYLYAGSALGKGGVAGRLRHHLKRASRPHWHIDFLRQHLAVEQVWYCVDGINREHDWSEVLRQWRGAVQPIPGFGASDCRCVSHLTYLPYRPSLATFRRRSRLTDPAQGPISILSG